MKKIIDITDRPDEWQEGDHFEGTKEVPGGATAKFSGPLYRSVIDARLFLVGGSYVNRNYPSWRDVKVTREVDKPSEYIKFTPGSVIRGNLSGETYHLIDGEWVRDNGQTAPILLSMTRNDFDKYFTLLLGSFEDDDR